jgi:hypothetical protein
MMLGRERPATSNDVALWGSLACSVAAHTLLVSGLYLALAIIIWIGRILPTTDTQRQGVA